MSENWYSTVDPGTRLTQGDLILNCPLIGWGDELTQMDGAAETEILKQSTRAFRADVVVMTQACDLEHDKVSNVVVCPHLPLAEYKCSWEDSLTATSQNPTSKAWRSHCNDVREGLIWNLSILNSLGRRQTKPGLLAAI